MSGYEIRKRHYRSQSCEGCPLKERCTKAEGNREVVVSLERLRYQSQAREQRFSSNGRIAALLNFCGFKNEESYHSQRNLLLGQPLLHFSHCLRFARWSLGMKLCPGIASVRCAPEIFLCSKDYTNVQTIAVTVLSMKTNHIHLIKN
ncbi:Transposase DDE domain-containing protein [Paenibacillus jilunlii]|uniref:Transposase DDE domain-containing protein n=1 Tax=Paenibacillus jilunlii TaxID=682956 RepID=A0A1G9U9Z3_9BACL|nr:transposase [Paenibacillus jilunlii]SDM56643.1 Transposase DDE domain-containing protein [Paenibacillus jilunlii]